MDVIIFTKIYYYNYIFIIYFFIYKVKDQIIIQNCSNYHQSMQHTDI